MNYKPFVAVDIALFSVADKDLRVLLIKRTLEPFAGCWVIPGGILQENESLDQAALRQLKEKAGISDAYLEQLYTFGDPQRDPRERSVAVAYVGLVPEDRLEQVEVERKAGGAEWFSMYNLPSLGFDHLQILEYALTRLRAKLEYTNAAYSLLPQEFTLTDLQALYEVVFHEAFDRRNFRKKILAADVLEPTGKQIIRGAHRPAQAYRFKKRDLALVDMT
jgi:8-oxo-dGTP diphosphatase